jgi:RpiR family transcriptional regulator, carbohydrate utilization regulator
MENEKDCLVTIKSVYPSMHEVERKIADFLLKKPEAAIYMTVSEISAETGVADSSIIRTCQRLGFSGFSELKINMAKNLKKHEENVLEDLDEKSDPFTVASRVFSSSIKALEDTIGMLDKTQLSRAVRELLAAQKIEFYGVGTSSTIAIDAYYRFMRIGLPAYVATDPHIARVSASKLNSRCVAVGISHTGRTKDTVRVLQIAKSRGAKVICITSYMKSPITELSDICLITSTTETRKKTEAVSSRIAQIALLDSIYTCIVLRKYDSAAKNITAMTNILNETRLR